MEEEEEEEEHPPGLALSLQGEVSSTHWDSGDQEQARGSQAEDQIKICLLKACSDNLAQTLVPMGRREGIPH